MGINRLNQKMITGYEILENTEIQSEERILMPGERSDNKTLCGLHEILTREQIEFLDNERLWARNQVKLHEIIVLMREKIENCHKSRPTDPSISRKLEAQRKRIRIKEEVNKCDHKFKVVMSSVAVIA